MRALVASSLCIWLHLHQSLCVCGYSIYLELEYQSRGCLKQINRSVTFLSFFYFALYRFKKKLEKREFYLLSAYFVQIGKKGRESGNNVED